MTTETLWVGASLTFQNNNDIVVVNTGDDIQSIEPNDVLFSSNYGEPVEVASAYITADASPVTVIKLTKPWPGGSGTFSATVVPSGTSIAAVAKKLNTLHDTYSALAQNVSNIVTGDSLVQRLNDGRVKGANAEDNDDLVAKGQLDSLTQSYLNNFGIGGVSPIYTDWNVIPLDFGGFLQINVNSINRPTELPNSYYLLMYAGISNDHILAFETGLNRVYKLRRNNGTWVYDGEFYHSGNSKNPLDYGIGGVKTLPSSTSLLSITENGLYYVPSATNAPSAQTPNWLILVNSTNNSAYRTVKAWGVGKIAVSYGEYTNTLENGTWGGWRTVYDSGNSKNPLEYGMAGSTALVPSAPNNNLNEVTETRIVRADNANDKPTYRDDGVTPGMSFYLNRYSEATSHRGSEICFGHLNSASPKSGLWHRSLSGTNGPSEWLEVYDSGNSVNPIEYGIGAQSVANFSDWNAIPSDFRGMFRVVYNAPNTPVGVDPLYVYHGMFVGAQYDPLMIIWGADGAKPLKEYALRVALSGDTWEGTKTFDLKAENYHSGNTNFNEFSAGSANDIIAYGYAVTSGIVQLFFPLNSKTAPVSLTVNGTFKLKGAADADRATGITTLGLNNLSTNKLGVCRVSSGLTGVVQGEPIVLVATASGDSVTFNF